jgi:hypothetical protein
LNQLVQPLDFPPAFRSYSHGHESSLSIDERDKPIHRRRIATAPGYDDFVITGATVSTNGSAYWTNWSLIATSIVDAQRTPSTIVPGGIFLTRTWTLLPDTNK